MSNISFLQNVGASTKLKEGSIEDLMKRVTKIQEGLSDIEKAKLDTALADSFTNVSATLDKIELDQAQAVVNRLQGSGKSRSGIPILPSDDPNFKRVANQKSERGFSLPRAEN